MKQYCAQRVHHFPITFFFKFVNYISGDMSKKTLCVIAFYPAAFILAGTNCCSICYTMSWITMAAEIPSVIVEVLFSTKLHMLIKRGGQKLTEVETSKMLCEFSS